MYIVIKFTIDCLTFKDNFGKNFVDALNVEFLSNIINIVFSLNPYLPANLFTQEPINLDTQSVAKVNAMQSSVLLISDTDKSQQYAH